MPNASSTVHYDIHVKSIHQRLFAISLSVPAHDSNTINVRLPAWIPGSYMIRDFAKNIVSLSVRDSNSEAVTVTQVDKQSWQIDSHGRALEIHYTVYANDLSVRSAYIDESFCFFNGTSVFLAVDGMELTPVTVNVRLPSTQPHWLVKTSMSEIAGTQHQYSANGYADLIEHPVLMGELLCQTFEMEKITFEMVFAGLESYPVDINRVCQDLAPLCQHHIDFFGSAPDIDYYPFLTMVTQNGYGGLEHDSSTALMCSKDMLPHHNTLEAISDAYQNFLSLCSHEFFHTWHVKRIKPDVFYNLSLQQEVYTEQLWLFEGITSYYDDLSLNTAQVVDEKAYLKVLSKGLTRLLRNHGQQNQTVTESSFNAWTKFYKQDENATNAIVSYYNKGAIIALCIDLYIRQQTTNEYSLKSVMQALWSGYLSNDGGTRIDSMQHMTQTITGVNIEKLLHSALYTTETLPYEALLKNVGVGCDYYASEDMQDTGGARKQSSAINYFGANYQENAMGVMIKSVHFESPAESAGLKAGDILLAVQGEQITQKTLQPTLNAYQTGKSVELHLFRRGQMKQLTMPLIAPPQNAVRLVIEDKNKAQTWLRFSDS